MVAETWPRRTRSLLCQPTFPFPRPWNIPRGAAEARVWCHRFAMSAAAGTVHTYPDDRVAQTDVRAALFSNRRGGYTTWTQEPWLAWVWMGDGTGQQAGRIRQTQQRYHPHPPVICGRGWEHGMLIRGGRAAWAA
jgi:hypothetical protein